MFSLLSANYMYCIVLRDDASWRNKLQAFSSLPVDAKLV